MVWTSFLTDLTFKRVVSNIGNWISPIVLLIMDYLAIVSANLTSYKTYHWFFGLASQNQFLGNGANKYFYYIIPLMYIGLIAYERLYTKRMAFWQSAEKLLKISTYSILIIVGIIYFVISSEKIPHQFLIFTWISSFSYLLVARYLVKKLLTLCGLWQKPVIAVGTIKNIELLAKAFEDEPTRGYKIAGVIVDKYDLSWVHKYRFMGEYNNIEQAIIASRVQDVIIAAPEMAQDKLLHLVDRIQPLAKELIIMPNLTGFPLSNMEVETLANKKIMLFRTRNMLRDFRISICRAVFNYVFASFIFVILIPIMTILAILIKLDSPGPVLYIGKRLGRKGREFNCYKFRSMYINEGDILQQYLTSNKEAAKEWQQFAKLKSYDPRVTKIGKWLRKLSLDELPQILNVMKGEMSLVGPRPYLPREYSQMKGYANNILETLPGITGLWQVSGRNDIDFEGRLYLDSWYVKNWSVWLDITLLFKTIGVVLKREGAY